ncbi:MAG: hypothetical protein NTY67_02825 [Cyanobacteria bacterium]|nr:hypothetical protein [Cyanobacteriota bacterium]
MIQASSLDSSRNTPPPATIGAARRLVWLANGLLAAYLVQAAAVLFEPHVSLGAALAAVSARQVDLAFLPVLAVGLLQVARQLYPADGPLNRRCRRNRESRLLVGVLLILVPLQLLVGWGELHRLREARHQDGIGVGNRLREMRRAILAAPSLTALQGNLQALQAPELPAELLRQPLPELKRRLLATLALAERRSAAADIAAMGRSNPATDALWRRLFQTCLLALIYAFSLLGGLPGLLRDRGGGPDRLLGGPPGHAVDGDYFETLSENYSPEQQNRQEP